MHWTVRLEVRTSQGEVTTTELVTFSRPAVVSTLAEVGLVLSEIKALLAKLQASMLCGPVAAYAAHHRASVGCGALQPLKDRRTCRLQTLFGAGEVEAPRFKACRCRQPVPMTVSPVCALLSARCTPELERVQAELGARTSFRDGARILEALLPVSPANHESLRSRTYAIALQLEAADRQAAAEITAVRDDTAKAAAADASRPVVMLDGAYIRAVPGHQVRNFEATCGKVEREGQPTRRFALVRSVAEQPHALLRAALQDQGWREGGAVTAISDGDPAFPALVRSATGGPVDPILDWFHLSMRVQHVEQVIGGLCAVEPPLAPLDHAQIDVERLHHLLWSGHGQRSRAGKPISTSRAGGHRQPAGECPHDQAPPDALVAPRRPPNASAQGRSAGQTVWPPSDPACGVAPQVFDISEGQEEECSYSAQLFSTNQPIHVGVDSPAVSCAKVWLSSSEPEGQRWSPDFGSPADGVDGLQRR